MTALSVLEYLQKHVAGELRGDETTHMRYPTAISRTLAMRIVAVGRGEAEVAIDADPAIHGNQQGTVHGGLICELADAAIGTAHSTLMEEGDSFATVEFKINFFRPCGRRLCAPLPSRGKAARLSPAISATFSTRKTNSPPPSPAPSLICAATRRGEDKRRPCKNNDRRFYCCADDIFRHHRAAGCGGGVCGAWGARLRRRQAQNGNSRSRRCRIKSF